MRLSRAVCYGVQALRELAQDSGYGGDSPHGRAQSQAMPKRLMLQILQNLVTQGVLDNDRGVNGRYALARPLERISLLDVIEAIESPIGEDTAAGPELVDNVHVNFHAVCKEITAMTRERLSRVTVADLSLPSHGTRVNCNPSSPVFGSIS